MAELMLIRDGSTLLNVPILAISETGGTSVFSFQIEQQLADQCQINLMLRKPESSSFPDGYSVSLKEYITNE